MSAIESRFSAAMIAQASGKEPSATSRQSAALVGA